MTKRLRLLFLIATLFLSARVSGQLSITSFQTSIPIFPAHADSLAPYYANFSVYNSDSMVTFVDFIDVMYKSNNRPIDTIASSPFLTLNPFDSVSITDSSIQVNSAHFDDGDNIVVIWPAARNTPSVGDTTIIHIYYDTHIGVDEINPLPVKIYPNPATDYLYLGGLNEFKLKRVRILDVIGKEIYSGKPASEMIPVKNLSPGTYMISVESADGRHRLIQFVKE